jgi:hypothetical protein
MLIFDSTEINEEKGERTIVEQYESLNLGIAVQARSVFEAHSQLLGMTVGEFLQKNNMVLSK